MPVAEDLPGHWRIVIDEFYSFGSNGPTFGEHQGPWVLEFDVGETP